MNKDLLFIKYHLKNHGGLEKHFNKIIDAYLKKDAKITILTTKTSKDFSNKKKIKIVIFKPLKIFKFLKLKIFDIRCSRWIKKNQPEVIFAFDRTSKFTHTRLGNGLHYTYLKRRELFESPIKSFLNKINPLHRAILKIEKKAFEQKDLKKVIVNSSMVKEELIKAYNFDPKKITTILNGVEYKEYEKHFCIWEKEKNSFAKKLNLDPNTFHFVFIGHDYKRKGLKYLIKALSNIKNKNFHLSIIGKEKNLKKYINYVKLSNIEKKVTFFNKRDNIINFLQLADAFVLPTLYDPFSNVVVEALAMGVYVITSKYNGAREIMNKQNGKVIDPLDTIEFTNALLYAMQNRKDHIRAKQIRESVKNLDFENQLNTFFKELL
ncbi:MAG: Glycogen synthase [Candidatus Anoxychlamydiales bacterium]|nr:Glycogen synthase [Candidatus Anoxychlamydiales bacterium]